MSAYPSITPERGTSAPAICRSVLNLTTEAGDEETASDTFHFSAGLEALCDRPEGISSSITSILEAIHPEDQSAAVRLIERTLKGDVEADLAVDFRVLLLGGQTRWLLVTGKAEPNGGNMPLRLAGVAQDITERRQAEARIAYMARHDALTGLANRTTLEEHLQSALLRGWRGEACAVLALDLDGFNEVNDALGHAVGDAVLRSTAARLRRSIREVDVVARLGGDEFVIIQSNVHHPRDAEVFGERLVAKFERPHMVNGHVVSAGISIGIVMVPTDSTNVEQVLKVADLALYAAKKQGGHCYRFFEPEMQARAERRRQIVFELQQALINHEFELHYQPFVELAENRILGFEALVRWRHPVRGLVLPNEFVTFAEETGLIEPLGIWVLNNACAEAARWPAPLRVAVNVSVRQFSTGNLPDVVATALAQAGLKPGRLELEVTETMLLDDTEENLATLHQLRGQGVSISVDDFGIGYSSLSYFAKFPIDRMKINRFFIAKGQEKKGAAIIRSVIDLCGNFDIAVTAEGIETAEQLRLVSSLGCTECQGFFFARPCPAEGVADLLNRWKHD